MLFASFTDLMDSLHDLEIESVEGLGSGGEDKFKSVLNFEILFSYALKDL
jgi:hypothetical protein